MIDDKHNPQDRQPDDEIVSQADNSLIPNPSPRGRRELTPSPSVDTVKLPSLSAIRGSSPSPSGRGQGEGTISTKHKLPLSPKTLSRIRSLRTNATDAERLLWSILKNRGLENLKFRRQYPCCGFILDFYCHEHQLAIELDGGGHTEPGTEAYDALRTAKIADEGIRLIRFWNHDVLHHTAEVIAEILASIQPDS